jgi:acyl carrier protein
MNVNTPAETLPHPLAGDQAPFERQIAALIVSCLHLEITADEIEPDAPLFGDGLGLDSIDALELALAISRSYGLELKSDDEHNQAIFASLRSLARHVELHRTL